MEEKKIIYVHTGIWPTPSPSIVFITGNAYGLAHHAPTALIVKNEPEKSTDEFLDSLTGDVIPEKTEDEIFHSITGADKPENLDIIRVGKGSEVTGNAKFFRKAVRIIGSLAKKRRAMAVITRSIGFLPYLAYIRLRYRVPCFFETHDFYSDLSLRNDLKKSIGLFKNSRFEKTFLPRLDGIICLTETQAGFFKDLYPSVPRTVAPTGLMRVVRTKTKPDRQVCYIGSLDAHKGLGTALSALAQTADSKIKLLVVGGKNDHEKQEFKKFTRLLKLEKRVKVISWIHHTDIGHLIDNCMAGLVPLTDTPFNRYFTSPLKILDYLAHSLPVIASDLPSVRDYIEDGRHGILFEPENAENLAKALDLYVTRNKYETMSPEVESHAKQFLWTRRGEKIIEFINNNSRK